MSMIERVLEKAQAKTQKEQISIDPIKEIKMSIVERALVKSKIQKEQIHINHIYKKALKIKKNIFSIKYNETKVMATDPDSFRKNRLMAFFDDTTFSDQYRKLKTHILQKIGKSGGKALLVTSTLDREGKSITAANLAISMAKELEQTVLLVDADLRMPYLYKLFNIGKSGGLVEYLHGKSSLSDLLINPGIDKLSILAGHKKFINSTEIIGSPDMKKFVEEIKSRYKDRYIIFDSPPILSCSDSVILSSYVDGVILVVEYGKTQRPDLEKAVGLLHGNNLIGTVLNKSPMPKNQMYSY